MLKRILVGLAGLVVFLLMAAGVLYVCFMTPSAPPIDCPLPLDIGRVRTLANAAPGAKPTQVRVEHVMGFEVPWAMVRAGGAFEKVKMGVMSYQLVYPDKTLVIDTAMPASQATMVDYIDNASVGRVQKAMDHASAIFVTHEHFDHLGGVFAPGHENYRRAQLTTEQLSAPDRMDPVKITAEQKAALKPLDYDTMTAVAPGVVLIKAPGHTPGSQWVYIQRNDGAELLLVGDAAWQMANIELEQAPPVLMSPFIKHDRHAVACQMLELHHLEQQNPTVQVMPGHDVAREMDLVRKGLLLEQFI